VVEGGGDVFWFGSQTQFVKQKKASAVERSKVGVTLSQSCKLSEHSTVKSFPKIMYHHTQLCSNTVQKPFAATSMIRAKLQPQLMGVMLLR
jgi:hypothetical protein